MKKKKNIFEIQEMRHRDEPFAVAVIYDYCWAKLVDQTEIDMILCGDSMGMTVYGYDTTMPVTMEQLIDHCEAVRRGAPNTFLIADMTFGSYQESVEQGVHNAVRLIKETKADAVKLEGGRAMCDRIRAITDAGIVTFAHIGLTPQAAGILGGHKTQAKTVASARALIEDALAVQEAGAKAVLVESVPAEVMAFLVKKLDIPVFGAGVPCDGFGFTCYDMFGMYDRTPKFVKVYDDFKNAIIEGYNKFAHDVKTKAYPQPEHAYHFSENLDELNALFREYE